MQSSFFFRLLLSVINHYHIKELYQFLDSFQGFCLQISSDAKYSFLSYTKTLGSRIYRCYSILFSFLKQKKNIKLLLVELLAVTWVPCILRHYTKIEMNNK